MSRISLSPPIGPPTSARPTTAPIAPPASASRAVPQPLTKDDTSSTSTASPPTYAPSLPQILVTPLPDSPSFFWGRTVQGEVFVKGLGEGAEGGGVKSLTVQLGLDDVLPAHPEISLHDFPLLSLYPPASDRSPPAIPEGSASSRSARPPTPFASSHRFSMSLPPSLSDSTCLPGTLDLSSYDRGQVRWTLLINLTLTSGQAIDELITVEGTPRDVDPSSPAAPDGREQGEVEENLQRNGVKARMLVDTATPRLGHQLRLGVEVKPMERQKIGVAGLSSQPNPIHTLRPLRRVRVELFRRVRITSPSASPVAASSSSALASPHEGRQHLTLLYTSGKSLRYPGNSPNLPPLRVLFTIPTIQLGIMADQSWGEITQTTPYHAVSFFVRVTIGFGATFDLSASDAARDWILERSITIRPKIWTEPRQVVLERGMLPLLGSGSDTGPASPTQHSWGQGSQHERRITDEDLAMEAYRIKGEDVVGQAGTSRFAEGGEGEDDLPPPFEVPAGPSSMPNGHHPGGPSGQPGGHRQADGQELPTFLESEAQMRTGEAPVPRDAPRTERLVPVRFEDAEELQVGRPAGGIGGELDTWVEYDGYETFSVAPPSVSASFGVGGSMDPPQEGDEADGVVHGMAARLGLGDGVTRAGGLELMEQLGLGEGTRVVDLQDDMPPGIDEPSLPALPDFSAPGSRPRQQPPFTLHQPEEDPAASPPSFAASEAAQAVGAAAVSGGNRGRPGRAPSLPLRAAVALPNGRERQGEGEGEAPPGYFGGGAGGQGPPAYS